MISTASSGPRSATQRKRQRLDQLVGRIAHLVGTAPINRLNNKNKLNINNNNNSDEEPRSNRICVSLSEEDDEEEEEEEEEPVSVSMESSTGSGESPSPQQPSQMSRLRMRGNNLRHLHMHHHVHQHLHPNGGQVFSFDHVVHSDDEEEVFSPGLTPTFSDRLTLSPCSTTVDSPSGISFSPLSFADCPEEGASRGITRSLTSDPATPLNLSTGGKGSQHPHSTPFYRQLLATASDNRRRARSDSDLCDSERLASPPATSSAAAPASWVLTPASSSVASPPQSLLAPRLSRLEHLRPPPLMVSLKRNSSDSTDSWSPLFGQQESPVDLSVRSGSSVSSDSPNQTSTNTSTSSELSNAFSAGLETPPLPSRPGKSRGSRLKVLTRSLSLSQYLSAEYSSASLVDLSGADSDAVSPVMAAPLPLLLPGSSPSYGCDICGQIFDTHDRLVKHLSTRHKLPVAQQQQQRSAAADSGVVVKGYQCDVCQRPFARSDMLTRHMRLHTGLKPYTCRICGQVFSRSDHLSTHQRTHTGEKPYRCPQCSYAACRRDMITRHLRTHTRSEDLDGLSDPRKDSG